MDRVLGIALLTFLLNAQSEPAAYSRAAKGVPESIEEWQNDTKITLDAGARAQIADEVGQADWSKVYVPAEQHEQALAWTKDILVRAWLYSLLDRDRAQHSLTQASVAAHTFAEFIGTLGNEPFGFIDFLSAPAGAGTRAITRRSRVRRWASSPLGDAHTYDIVLSKEITCESTIKPRPGTTDRMTCPEKFAGIIRLESAAKTEESPAGYPFRRISSGAPRQ